MKHFQTCAKWIFILTTIQLFHTGLFAGGPDSCLINDNCADAILITNVHSDLGFVCAQGCNMYTAPDAIVAVCQMGDFPTVWYEVAVDNDATILNIEVHSDDFEAPSISLFKGNCGTLEQVNLSNGNLACIIGAQGVAKATGTYIVGATSYFIAVSSLYSIGGDFEICVSTISDGAYCVDSRSMEIVSRANPGPLEGPYDAGEKVRVCMNVENYIPNVENDCQWFQGLVPVFGNGWDPLSFDSIGQPYSATINGLPIGENQNGNYGPTTWDWFDNVGYHHPNTLLRIGDFDKNGRFEICNSVYEKDCQYDVNIFGGCCGPCWEEAGEVLPPGWFAYGTDGDCPEQGPPVSKDWGDGFACFGNMGPWNFCFDIVTRDTPDCLEDSTKQDLTLGFYTFADGETGAWKGSASVCSYDQPLKMTLNAVCGKIDRREPIIKPTLNSGDTFSFQIDERTVSYWEWNISPYHAMPHFTNTGVNGAFIEHEVINTSGVPIEVMIIFIGHEEGNADLIIKKVSFIVNPWTTGTNSIYDANTLRVYPNPASETAYIEWPDDIKDLKYLTLHNAQGQIVKELAISNQATLNRQEIDLKNLSKGLYFISVVTNRKIYTSRLIKS